ncbi:hypothetical protein OAL71_02750 [Phycisphaerales bacterium]|nr:hypothetical protein [Phycisphaerales bacterium]
MILRDQKYKTAAFLFMIGASACVARGDVMNLTFQNVSPGSNVTYSLDDGQTTRNTTAGVMNWDGGYETFCVQLEEYVSGGSTYIYDVVDVAEVPDADPGAMGAFRASLIEDLYARNYADIDTAVEAAAFQMSIWEIVHEVGTNGNDLVFSDLDLGSGMARFSTNANDVLGIASGFLSGLGEGSGAYLAYGGLRGLTNEQYQDQLIVVPGPAGLVAIAGFGLTRRRRRR